MLGPAWIFGMVTYSVFFSDNTWSCNYIPEAEAQKIISERADARIRVLQYKDGSKSLEIRLPEDRRIAKSTPWNDALLSTLAAKGITYQTLIEDHDFHNGGVQGWLVLLSTFIVVAGTVLLLRRPGTQKFYQQETATPRAERREKKIIAVCAALAMIAMSLVLVVYTIAHGGARTISGTEAGRIISEHKNAWFEVYQYANGPKELWITLSNSGWHRPSFITTADEPTLAVLAENNIPFKSYVQGRDFGNRGTDRWLLLSYSFILTVGAVFLLRWASNKERRFPAPAESRV
jgi:hypothetical protein